MESKPTLSMRLGDVTSIHDSLPDFVTEPPCKYQCVSCENILRPPALQTMCGHRLCGQCVSDLFRDTDTTLCPANDDCEHLTMNQIFPDVCTDRETQRMPVYCSFRHNGCQATPKWRALKDHVTICEYAPASCHNPGCDVVLLRAKLRDHETECGYLPILCETCDDYVPKKEIQNGHQKTCRPKLKKCLFEELGCTYEGTPAELKQHASISAQIHDQQLVKAATRFRQENVTLKQQLDDLVPKLSDIQIGLDQMRANLNHKKLQELQKSVDKMSQDIINIKEQLKQKKELEEVCSKVTDIQNVANMQESRIAYLEQGASGGAAGGQMIQKVRQMETSIGAYDVRTILAQYDIQFHLLETAGFDGQLIWKITNYQRRKKDAKEGRTLSVYSQPFYTSYYGYKFKLCARAYLNGDGLGRGTHLSLFLAVVPSEYDTFLPWPLRKKVTIALLDQSGNLRHITDTFKPDPKSNGFRRPVDEMYIAAESPQFARHAVVECDSYLKNDTIFIRINTEDIS